MCLCATVGRDVVLGKVTAQLTQEAPPYYRNILVELVASGVSNRLEHLIEHSGVLAPRHSTVYTAQLTLIILYILETYSLGMQKE